MDSVISVLVLYADYSVRASYYDDWIEAFIESRFFNTVSINICDSDIKRKLYHALPDMDAVVLLHSTNADQLFYLEPIVPILENCKAKVFSFVGNEVNLPGAPIEPKRKILSQLNPDYIATQLLQEAGDYLWGDIAPVVSVPHALNPKSFFKTTLLKERPLDLGVRSFRYPPHLGDDDRNRLMDYFQVISDSRGLRVDIGEERLDRQGWAAFLNSTRGTLATEAGSWYLSRSDQFIDDIQNYVRSQNRRGIVLSAENSRLRRIAHKLPWWVRQLILKALRGGPIRYESTLTSELSFDEIYEKFFKSRERAPVYTKCISSRHFDAMGTGTGMILFKGRYNDILVPDLHYFALEHDFSNIDEILARFEDPGQLQDITEASLEHALGHHTYTHRVETIASILNE
ncbi:glycosyltransferase [Sedimenticola selenatireducens]|uniref:Glycosyltransferase family 1 protein n=1 Tax=Sedimenticola selenatireducens TaxID=191960 RepID=A0A558DUI7_9GAMM|nr:glycosyltransferase [Sedimenticola selenatireducens]TVO72437.1 glycosyltransferase family 1 protein [Sedimenticola selenatireducens]TVT64692.1 MAG: glycosyltransferase family 1 protein [Sedimenticola selenatireducens]